jgi:hypothetical protein
MENRALRKELAKKMKEAGIGKLYVGNFRTARRYYDSSTMKYLLERLELFAWNDCK